MRTHLVVAATVAALAGMGCSEPKDPLSGTHDIAARAASQDLTVERLSKLLGNAKIRVEMTPQNGLTVANMWSTYHRLAYAAAHNDTLAAQEGLAIAATLNGERVNRILEALRRPMHADTATQAAYESAAHGLYAVRHMLFAYPPNASPVALDSVKKLATNVRKSLTPANFADMARKYSADKQSAPQGGYLGVIPRSAMNPAIVGVISSLKPDSISNLVPTPLGIDVIMRVSWADARAQYVPAFSQTIRMVNDSITSEKLSRDAGLKIGDAALAETRDAMLDLVKSSRDTTTVLATFDKGGKFTVSDLVAWLNIMPPLQRTQVMRGMPQVPDSLGNAFIRNLASRAILVRAADSAKLDVSDVQKADLREQFRKGVLQTWRELGVAPEQLADGKTPVEREQLASKRIDEIIDKGMAGTLQLSPVPLPIETALNARYESVTSSLAIQKAVDGAVDLRRGAEAARSAVPGAASDSAPPPKPATKKAAKKAP